jgi:hypothetical protein
MRWAITGGAGFLGLHLARRLLADGHEVRTLDLAPLDDAELERSVEELRGDVRDPSRGRAPGRGRRRARPRGRRATDPGLARVDPLGERRWHRGGDGGCARGRGAPCGADLVDRGLRRAEAPPDRRDLATRRGRPLRRVEDRGRAGRAGLRPARARGRDLRPKTFIGPERLGVFEILFDWIREGRRSRSSATAPTATSCSRSRTWSRRPSAPRAPRSPARPSTSARPSSAPSAPTWRA